MAYGSVNGYGLTKIIDIELIKAQEEEVRIVRNIC